MFFLQGQQQLQLHVAHDTISFPTARLSLKTGSTSVHTSLYHTLKRRNDETSPLIASETMVNKRKNTYRNAEFCNIILRSVTQSKQCTVREMNHKDITTLGNHITSFISGRPSNLKQLQEIR